MASLVGITSLAELDATDNFNWNQLPSGGTFTSIPSPESIVSGGGVTGTISGSGGLYTTSIYLGNITYPNNVPASGTLLFTLNTPVSGFGAQIETPGGTGSFTGVVTAFDSGNNELGSFQENGNTQLTYDGSAIFIGLAGTTNDISKLEFSDTQGTLVGIGTLSIAETSATPLPAALPLFGTALAGLALVRRRAKKQAN